jgi:hypothetical protein
MRKPVDGLIPSPKESEKIPELDPSLFGASDLVDSTVNSQRNAATKIAPKKIAKISANIFTLLFPFLMGDLNLQVLNAQSRTHILKNSKP